MTLKKKKKKTGELILREKERNREIEREKPENLM